MNESTTQQLFRIIKTEDPEFVKIYLAGIRAGLWHTNAYIDILEDFISNLKEHLK